jgi:hypothetical protein
MAQKTMVSAGLLMALTRAGVFKECLSSYTVEMFQTLSRLFVPTASAKGLSHIWVHGAR